MSESETAMSVPEPSFYQRLNELEKEMHTVRHTLRQFEHERLPQRLTTMETVVPRLAADVASIEKSVDDLTRTMTLAVGAIKDENASIKARVGVWSACVGAAVVVAQLLISAGVISWPTN